ncbi:MAG: NAD(P)/FAD-dependent oxidoreductase [Gemmatimonadales bacterium]
MARQRDEALRCDWLESADVARRFPGAAPCRGALFAPDDGAVDPPALTRALLADATRQGAALVRQPVSSIMREGDRISGVDTPDGPIPAPQVVIAAGAWSGRIAGLPRPLPVEPVRGQLVAVPWPAATPRAILYGHQSYVLARGREAVLGSTMESVGFDPRVTELGVTTIRDGARRLIPALGPPSATPARAWAGLRPVTPDGHPIIGPDPEIRGLWYATGHGRNGILLAALTGEIIGMLLAGEAPAIDLAPFSASRFRSSVVSRQKPLTED